MASVNFSLNYFLGSTYQQRGARYISALYEGKIFLKIKKSSHSDGSEWRWRIHVKYTLSNSYRQSVTSPKREALLIVAQHEMIEALLQKIKAARLLT